MNPSPYGPPPGGPSPVLPPGRPWLPPPRRRRVNPVVPLALFAALSASIVGGIYYVADYRPRHYLQDWAKRMNPPEGRFVKVNLGGDTQQRTVSFTARCTPSDPCDPPPARAISHWITTNGGDADESDVSQCFHYGGGIQLITGDHNSHMECQQISALNQEITFTVRLQY
jgi:hypothetical protein